MPFLYETLKPTFIVYDSDLSDEEAAKLIAKRKGFNLLQTDEHKDPTVPDPIYDENNLVCVGLWAGNAYTKHYFPDLTCDVDPLTGYYVPPLYGIPGSYSKDGKRVISTITRPNGTTVTVVGGLHPEDTLQAAYDYTKVNVLPLAVTLVAEVAAAIAIAKM